MINAIEKGELTVIKQIINVRECISQLSKVRGPTTLVNLLLSFTSQKQGFSEAAVNWDAEDELSLTK